MPLEPQLKALDPLAASLRAQEIFEEVLHLTGKAGGGRLIGDIFSAFSPYRKFVRALDLRKVVVTAQKLRSIVEFFREPHPIHRGFTTHITQLTLSLWSFEYQRNLFREIEKMRSEGLLSLTHLSCESRDEQALEVTGLLCANSRAWKLDAFHLHMDPTLFDSVQKLFQSPLIHAITHLHFINDGYIDHRVYTLIATSSIQLQHLGFRTTDVALFQNLENESPGILQKLFQRFEICSLGLQFSQSLWTVYDFAQRVDMTKVRHLKLVSCDLGSAVNKHSPPLVMPQLESLELYYKCVLPITATQLFSRCDNLRQL
ncbi:MAG TPA: hypothetical protein VN457_05765, partial [Chlamydiales bacterium]|nr:hypothetical protein [Chlamydiales bacterium]